MKTPKKLAAKIVIILLAIVILTGCANLQTQKPNTLTNKEIQQGWMLLFDGKSINQWRGRGKDHLTPKNWKIKQGLLTIEEIDKNKKGHAGDIITKKRYGNFELKLDYKITEGSNTGIKYFVSENLAGYEGIPLGLEYQIIDDAPWLNAEKPIKQSHTVASLYDMIASQNKRVNPPGQWNHVRIFSKDSHVEHWLNGIKVVEFQRGSEEFKALVAKSKYARFKGFGLVKKGNILLQDHFGTPGHPSKVCFKNIKIREL